MPEPYTEQPTVFVVDDDAAVRASLGFLIGSVGLRVESFPSASAFLDKVSNAHCGCVVLDVRIPGQNGLDLHREMVQRGLHLPVIFITGHGTVAMAVRALQQGAAHFFEKPFSDQELLGTIQSAVDDNCRNCEQRRQITTIRENLSLLTTREREVMDLVIAGKTNREVAETLCVSPKTVEVHRAHVMEKMGAATLADLVQMVIRAGELRVNP